jgi:hypothetical protein
MWLINAAKNEEANPKPAETNSEQTAIISLYSIN